MSQQPKKMLQGPEIIRSKRECLADFAAICAPAYRRWKEKQVEAMLRQRQVVMKARKEAV